MVPNHNSSHLNLHMYCSHPFVNKLKRDEKNLERQDPVQNELNCAVRLVTHTVTKRKISVEQHSLVRNPPRNNNLKKSILSQFFQR